jgi:RNA polymerase sigma factor (sigma-70 family)
MTEGKPYLPWPGGDDRIVVEEMKRDLISGQWYECREFVKGCVQKQAQNIPKDSWDDIVQDAMIRVNKFLPTFRFHCALRTWLFGIARSSVIDAYRKFKRAGQQVAPPEDPHDDAEHEGDAFTARTPGTLEDECITRDELGNALTALQEYVAAHANRTRNGRILDMVLLEGHSLEEAARAVGCSAALAGYVVRSAQRYVREKLGYRR